MVGGVHCPGCISWYSYRQPESSSKVCNWGEFHEATGLEEGGLAGLICLLDMRVAVS